jgi:hypothetical protein
MFDKFKICTSTALLAGLSACTNIEVEPSKSTVVTNPELCVMQANYIKQFEQDIRHSRPLVSSSENSSRIGETTKQDLIKGVSVSSDVLPTGTEITKVNVKYASNRSKLSNFSASYQIPRQKGLRLNYNEADAELDLTGKAEPVSQYNKKIIIRQFEGDRPKQQAICKVVDFSKK